MTYPPISVVIPCFNQGQFLKEALASLEKCDSSLFETIIVNDGSTDDFTNDYLKQLDGAGHRVIFQENKGLGEARNVGIKHSKGKYILPLDADNKIDPGYLTKSLEAFSANEQIAVVYGNCNYFGGKTGIFKPGNFNLQRLMLGNFIDACAVIKKSVIEDVGYYDNMKIMGFEDWDLWLRMAFKDYKFHYIDEVLFDYRVNSNSMISNLNANIKNQNTIKDYILNKYPDKLSFDLVTNLIIYNIKKRPFDFVYRQFLQRFFPSYYKKLIQEHKIYKGMLYNDL